MIRILILLFLVTTCRLAVWADAQCDPVVNAASFQRQLPPYISPGDLGASAIVFRYGVPSGGSLATLFCSGLEAKPGTFIAAALMPPVLGLGGISVAVNGAHAALLSVFVPADPTAKTQINFQMPLERNAEPNAVSDTVWFFVGAGVRGTSFSITGKRGIGGFFSDGNGFAAALHDSDRSAVTIQNPAGPGERIVVFANDFFRVWPPPPIAFPVPSQAQFERILNEPLLFPGDHLYLQDYPKYNPPVLGAIIRNFGSFTSTPELKIVSERLASGMIGVEEITFIVPPNQAPGDWALFFNEGSCLNGRDPLDCGLFRSEGISSAFVKLPVR